MKKILILIIGLFLVSLVSAVNDCGNDNSYLGTFAVDKDISLIQTCDSCSFVNLTKVTFPNSSFIVYNTAMTEDGTEYNSSFNNTDSLGCYSYVILGDKGGTNTAETIDFKITYTGKELSESSSIFYIVLFAIFIFLFIMTLLGINKLPNSNTTDEEGIILKISYLKYLRPVLWFVAWMFIVAILYIASNLGFAYLEDTLFANFLFTLFKISFGLSLPMVFMWFIWIFVRIVDDKKIKQMWERGFFQQKVI